MKIAYAMINVNRHDGSARAVVEVAERLAKRHDVHLFARNVEDANLDKITWHKIPGLGWPEVADFLSYRWLSKFKLKLQDFDIVHSIGCNAWEANVVTIQNIQPVKARILERLSRNESVSLPRKMTRWLYLKTTSAAERSVYEKGTTRHSTMFLPVSKGVCRELKKTYNIGRSSIKIIPNAADIKHFQPSSGEEKQNWRSRNGLKKEDIIAIFVGGEWARKGLDFAIKSVARSKHRNLKLFIAGTDPDEARFRQMAAETGKSERIIFGGFRKDVAKAIGAADLFLFPSWYEAFSLASIEAAACGLPIVTTHINGTEDFIRPDETGVFIERDPDNIAVVLDEILMFPQRLKKMGKAARKLVESKYTWDQVADETEKAYRELLEM